MVAIESVEWHLPNMQKVSICTPAPEERDQNKRGGKGGGEIGKKKGEEEEERELGKRGEDREGGGRQREEGEESNKWVYYAKVLDDPIF